MARFQRVFFIFLAGTLWTTTGSGQTWLQEYNKLLQTYRSDSGIAYAAWKKNTADLKKLDSIVTALAIQTPPDSNDAAEIAYYTNTYNILVLHGVLAETPLKSVKDIAFNFGFFSQKRFTLGGEKVSLNEIEKIRLLKQFGDARIHFIVNCASTSCPPLPATGITSDNLEAIMNQATTAFLNDHPAGIRELQKGHFAVSKLFDWYQSDFEKSAGNVIQFINRYRRVSLPEKAKISYLEYSWNLNQSD
ncbi:MAG: DUF547 domain-containing protein [Verrucomicrobiota bacterium]